MIYWLTREDYADTAQKLCKGLSNEFNNLLPLSYEQVFYERQLPRGHYIFSDFDRMSSYEIECAISITDEIRNASPESNILNDPRLVLERVPLLTMLYRLGLNQFEVTRLDAGELPERYPVFIRLEDDCQGPDTDLIYSDEELEVALKRLRQQGHSLKRRIAVEFRAQKDAEGFYRKYGAFNIGGRIIPQHILRSEDWNVKSRGSVRSETFAEEERNYVSENPHQDKLLDIFNVANIDFGRIDYTLVEGEIQTFEINTNPTYPRFKGKKDARSGRRRLIQKSVVETLIAISSTTLSNQPISFSLPKPILQRPRIPRRSRFPARLNWALKEWESWDFKLLLSTIVRMLKR